MIPLRDDNPTRHAPYLTLILIALNILAFLLWQPTLASGARSDVEQQAFFFCHALVPFELTHQENLAEGGADAREALTEEFQDPRAGVEVQRFLQRRCPDKSWWESIFVAMFLHGSWLHIGGNMLFLWVFGNNVEDKLRPPLYLLFYLAAGVAATFAQTAFNPDSAIPNLGASGAIAGVLGAYLVMFPRRRVLTLVIFLFITTIYLPAFVVLGAWFVLQLFNGVAALGTRVAVGGGVAVWAHVGGFVFGALLALLFFPKERFGARPLPRRPDTGWGRRSDPRRQIGRRRPYDEDEWY